MKRLSQVAITGGIGTKEPVFRQACHEYDVLIQHIKSAHFLRQSTDGCEANKKLIRYLIFNREKALIMPEKKRHFAYR
jgi:hypothetical protein